MRSLWGAAIGGASVSLGIETVQFLLDVTASTGRVADIDDVIGKAMGALAGALLYRLVMLVPTAPRMASALAFPTRAPQNTSA